jgi:hypothetical protein
MRHYTNFHVCNSTTGTYLFRLNFWIDRPMIQRNNPRIESIILSRLKIQINCAKNDSDINSYGTSFGLIIKSIFTASEIKSDW